MNFSKTLLLIPVLTLAACSSGGKSDPARPAASAPAQRSTLSQRMSEQNGYAQDDKGNWAPKIDRRSQFESERNSPYFKGEVAKKDYKTGDYAKKPFWGTKEVERKSFDGKTDGNRFRSESKIADKQSDEDGVASKLQKNYKTNDYATGAAREQKSDRIERTSDAETDKRREVYKAPSVINWEEQRAMNVSQTKGLLGRE